MKQLKEQTAFHDYQTHKRPVSSESDLVSRQESLRSRGEVTERGASEVKHKEPSAMVLTARSRTRMVVESPKPVRPSLWSVLADRREQLRRRHAKPSTYTVLVPRTLAQTGMSASRGRMRAIQPPQVQPKGSHVPPRSGQRRHRPGFFAKLIAFLVVLVIGVFGVNFALTSPAFRVQQVSVVGTQNPALVSDIQHMGMQGQNIFLIDTAALTARIEMLPLVASANLGKQWPNQLTVTVAERIPVLLWQTAYGIYAVDEQGVVIAHANETIGADKLSTVVEMRRQPVAEKGQPIRSGVRLNPVDVAFALQVFARLPQMTGITAFTLRYDATGPANVASAGRSGSYVIASPDGWLAYLGSAYDTNPLDNRLVELQQILALAQKQRLNLATIDLRFGLHPVYTLKNP